MPKFNVTIQRTEYRYHDFLVEASDRDAAERVADKQSCDFDWHDAGMKNAEEAVVATREVTSSDV